MNTNALSGSEKLYLMLSTCFCVVVIISNLIAPKLFPAPFIPNLALSAGVVTYPLTFILGGLVTEIFGKKKAEFMVYTCFAMGIISYLLIQLALYLPSQERDNQVFFEKVFGLNGLIVFSSMSAYFVAQMIDVRLYAFFKKLTRTKHLWLRNNGSALIAQFVDTIIVNAGLLYFGLNMPLKDVAKVILLVYIYKSCFSICNTPLFYLAVSLSKKYLHQNQLPITNPQ